MTKEFVEIAGIKWAKCNIGAEKETDIGLYFQWGDAQGYAADEVGIGEDENLFNLKSYKYENGVTGITKYNYVDGKTILEASDDAATANWGNDWRMPTKNEYAALRDAVNTEWTNDYKGSGVAGMICTDIIDPSKVLFFPACGYCFSGSVYNMGRTGYYWSSSLNKYDVQFVYCIAFQGYYVRWYKENFRRYGFPVRGVVC